MHVCIYAHVSHDLSFHLISLDVAVTSVFGPGESVLVSDVHCTGTEQELHQCHFTGSSNHSCDRDNGAGIICSRSFGKYHNKHAFLHRSLKDMN